MSYFGVPTTQDNEPFSATIDRVVNTGFIFDEVAGTALTENDAAMARIDSKRAIITVLEDATTRGRRATVSSGGALLVNIGTGAGDFGKAEDSVHTTGDVGAFVLGVAQNVASPVTFAAAGDYIPFGVDTEGAMWAIGNRRHDDVDAGAPVKIGLKAIAHGSNPTAVAAADRTDWYANRHGVPFVIGGHPNILRKEWVFTSAQTDVKIITESSGIKIVVTEAEVLLDADTTINVGCRLGLAASTLPTISNNNATGLDGIIISHPDIRAGGGVVVGNGSGIIAEGADGDDLIITCDAATGGSLRVLVSYFRCES